MEAASEEVSGENSSTRSAVLDYSTRPVRPRANHSDEAVVLVIPMRVLSIL